MSFAHATLAAVSLGRTRMRAWLVEGALRKRYLRGPWCEEPALAKIKIGAFFDGPGSACRMPASAPSRPITDSPWLWAYLFGMAALAALVLVAPKYSRRQAQIERQFEGRQRLWQRPGQDTAGDPPTPRAGSSESLLISLRPLLWLIGGLTLAAWLAYWLSRRHDQPWQPAAAPVQPPPSQPPPADDSSDRLPS